MKNLNPKENPVTTILGAMLTMVSVVMFVAPMFVTIKDNLNYWIPGVIGFVGLMLLLAPDDLRTILKSKADKISDKI